MKKIICITITCVLLLLCSASSYMIKSPLREDLPDVSDITVESALGEPVEESDSDETLTTENIPTGDNTVSDTLQNNDTDSDVPAEIPESSDEETAPEVTTPAGTVPKDTPAESESLEDSSSAPESTAPVTPPEEPKRPQLPELEIDPGIDPSKPMIVLSFDDGPSAYTERLLDILDENGAKATFFLVGKGITYRADTVKRMYESGHDIGTHTWSHPELTRLTREEMIAEITMAKDKLDLITGGNSYLVRPPYGSYNDDVKAVGAELGIAYVNWSVDTLDWRIKDAEQLHDKIVSSARGGAIILCHDIHKTTVDAMETVIPKLIEDGYQLVTFTDMMAFSHERLEGGNIYRMK